MTQLLPGCPVQYGEGGKSGLWTFSLEARPLGSHLLAPGIHSLALSTCF